MLSDHAKADEASQVHVAVRECLTVEEFDACVSLQREVFRMPDVELSPRRHLIVSKRAGGWTLGAFVHGKVIGFVHQMVGVRGAEIIGYSHMLAVDSAFQNSGVGARLKWAQRKRSVAEGKRLITWTWDPMQARNAHFNLNRLGVEVRSYAINFYGTDYLSVGEGKAAGIDSDRLFADWELCSDRVSKLSRGGQSSIDSNPRAEIVIPANWYELISRDPAKARAEQVRVRAEFLEAFSDGLVCRSFARDEVRPRYLLFSEDTHG